MVNDETPANFGAGMYLDTRPEPDAVVLSEVPENATAVGIPAQIVRIAGRAPTGKNPKRRVVTSGATADPVKDYLKQIGRVSLLNAEQEVDLSERRPACRARAPARPVWVRGPGPAASGAARVRAC